MRLLTTLAVTALCAVFLATGTTAGAPGLPDRPKAKDPCPHRHSVGEGRRAARSVLSAPRAFDGPRVRALGHYVKCSRTRREGLHVRAYAKSLRALRRTYGPSWHIRWQAIGAAGRSWTRATGACESGNDPRTDTGNGYRGAFQWLERTWRAAGGDRDVVRASWHHQATLAWRWHQRVPRGQWPVCSPG